MSKIRWLLVIAAFAIYGSMHLITDWVSFEDIPWLVWQWAYLINALLTLYGFLLPALLLLKGLGRSATWLKTRMFKPDTYHQGLAMFTGVSYVALGTLIAAAFISLLIALGIEPVLPRPIIPWTLWQLIGASVVIGGVTAICEELLFRLALPELLMVRFRQRTADILSALLFALIHFTLPGFPTLFLFGLIASRLFRKTGSLWLPIIMHAIYNITILTLNYAGGGETAGIYLVGGALCLVSLWLLFKKEKS